MAKVLVSMADEFLNKIDKVAANEQRTRSELIREALRSYIRHNRNSNPQKAAKNADLLDKLLG